MNVVFDYQVFFLQRYGGISRYFYELARELSQLPDCHASIVAPFHNNAYLNERPEDSFIYKINPLIKTLLQNRSDKIKLRVNDFLTLRQKAEILHETYYTHRIKFAGRKVVTVHDMIYEQMNSGKPGEKIIIDGKKKAIEEARAVIAVSEHTKKDLLRFYPWAEDKTFVVHHGVTQKDIDQIKPFDGDKPFILFVGHRGSYKNFFMLLDVYARDKNLHLNFDLIAFGGDDPTSEELSFIKANNLSGKVHFSKGNDELLYSTYKAASVFVYNSRYEGFGMPVLEAMQMRCPVICSNTTSLPEVSGDAALMVDPSESMQLASALNSILFNDVLKESKIKAGVEQAKKFTWKKCAEETNIIYKSLLNG